MPKKSLLIALGSTGQRIVDGVLRRVHWEYGGHLSNTVSCAKMCVGGEWNGNGHANGARA